MGVLDIASPYVPQSHCHQTTSPSPWWFLCCSGLHQKEEVSDVTCMCPRSRQQTYLRQENAGKDAKAKVECDILFDIERRLVRLLEEWCCVIQQGQVLPGPKLSHSLILLSVDIAGQLMLWRMSVCLLVVTTVSS